MLRFFISYSRSDRLFVDLLVPMLLPVYGNDSVWFDEQIPGGSDWWQLILQEIGRCDIFLMLISNDSLTSNYCQDECREALRLKKALLPIIVRPKTDIWSYVAPDLEGTLRKINYIDLSTGFKEPKAVTSLYGAINKLVENLAFRPPLSSESLASHEDIPGIIAAFFAANSTNNWPAAREAIAKLRGRSNVPDFFNIQKYEELVALYEMREQQYNVLRIMAEHDDIAALGDAFRVFHARFPDYDPDHLFDRPPHPDSDLAVTDLLPPPFEWCEIPSGVVSIRDASAINPPGSKGGQFTVPQFSMAKYPVTNAQFQIFVDAANGYANPNWWDFSLDAARWRRDNPAPKATAFPGSDFPRTNVCWYEAIAFCLWLSETTAQMITLPTIQQWQRAAEGNDNRLFPWGNNFDQKLCNFKTRGASPVTQFLGGASPYGVMDMVGNVLEWCLNEWSSGDTDLKTGSRRLLKGGSWHKSRLEELEITYLFWNYSDFRVDNRGFRIVKNSSNRFSGA